MWRTVRGVIVFFTIGETNPRYWAVTLTTWFALIAPAVVFASAGVSPPLIVQIGYSLSAVGIAGAFAARAEIYIRFRIATSTVPLPALLTLGVLGDLWQIALLMFASFAAYGVGLAFGLRERRAYLEDEFDSDA